MGASDDRTLGRYRLVEKIGAGGMGEVWSAIDTELEREVAIKFLPEHLGDDAERLARFEREAKTVAALDHPNIVTIHSVETHEGQRFFTMQLVKGEPLSASIPSEGMTLERFLDIAIPLADAMSAAHEQGIVHRDLKPANVMVTTEGRVKVLDFGLAKLGDRTPESPSTDSPTESMTLTRTGLVLGTIPYMSPEQVEGKPLDHRSDLFSLGVVLHQMATGRPPFKGDSRPALISSILRDEPPSVVEARPELPSELGRIVRHCLRKDPERRYQTAKELRNELEELRHTEMLEARRLPTPPATQPKREAKRYLWLAVAATVALLLVVAVIDRTGLKEWLTGGEPPPRIESLAILPLNNLSGDPDQEYFADGMTEALITELAQVGELKVISRTSVMQYKGAAMPLTQIGSALGVDAVVEGSVLREGDTIRVTAQLIDAGSDEHLWADSYDRDLRDVLELQRELARTIAERIHLRLTPEDRARLDRTDTIDPAAYEAYLKGQFYSAKMHADAFRRALSFFEEAIEKAPLHAPAHAGAASCYHLLAGYSTLPPAEGYEKARAMATRALELDDRNAEAHKVLGVVAFEYDWDWQGSGRHYRRALELNPNYAIALADSAWSLSFLGKHEAAIARAERAVEVDPLSLAIGVALGETLVNAGRVDEGIDKLRGVLELDPHFVRAHSILAVAHEKKGMLEEAIAENEKTVELSGEHLNYRARLVRVRALAGDEPQALRFLDELTERARAEYVSPINFTLVYMGLGRHGEAIDWLEKAYDARSIYMVTANKSPLFDPLRSEPRFQELLERMSFPPIEAGD
jgi:serine/threonine-protein kinase